MDPKFFEELDMKLMLFEDTSFLLKTIDRTG
jgi:hypothetical protein